MKGDVSITAAEAQALHHEVWMCGGLPIWTITAGTTDYPEGVVVRMFLVRRGYREDDHFGTSFVLLAGDLDVARGMLPLGLTCIGREPEDDPVIVESWV